MEEDKFVQNIFLELLCNKGRNENTVTGFQSSQNTFYVTRIMMKKTEQSSLVV
jgi:hypothetical protein